MRLFLLILLAPFQLVAGWGTPATLSDTSLDSFYCQLALNNLGQAIVAWQSFQNTDTTFIVASVYSGGSWSSPQNLSPDNNICNDARVAIDDSGKGMVLWTNTNNNMIQSSIFTGGAFGSVTNVSEPLVGLEAGTAQVAMDGSGNAIAIWKQFDQALYTIHSARLLVGNIWSSALLILSGADEPTSIRVANSSAINAIAMWETTNNGTRAIAYSRFLITAWTTPEFISESGLQAVFPSIKMASSGDAYAAWEQFDGTSSRIRVARFTSGAWGSFQYLSDSGLGTNSISVGVSINGTNAVATWDQQTGTDPSVTYGSVCTSNVWGASTPISDGNALGQSLNRVSLNSLGNAMTIWGLYNPDNDVDANVSSYSSGTWSAPQTINTNDDRVITPQVAINTTGFGVAIWQAFDGTVNKIVAVTFTP